MPKRSIPQEELPEAVVAFAKSAECRNMPLAEAQRHAVGLAKAHGERPDSRAAARKLQVAIERYVFDLKAR